jgi:hypothetical protein
MLTKEKCENALDNIICNIGVARSDYRKSGKAKEDYHTLKSLIEEHFSNPPLKFEELKEGMWVWDNKYKYYFECNPRISTDMTECVWYESFWYNTGEGYDEFYEDYIEFEENRFYRKQVKE